MPLSRKFRMMTTSLAPALTFIAFEPTARVEATWPPPPSRVIAWVMVSVPKPPGSRASISPPGAVFAKAPAHVRHGTVRLHGLPSLPTPEIQVLVACAWAGDATAQAKRRSPREQKTTLYFDMFPSIVTEFRRRVRRATFPRSSGHSARQRAEAATHKKTRHGSIAALAARVRTVTDVGLVAATRRFVRSQVELLARLGT